MYDRYIIMYIIGILSDYNEREATQLLQLRCW